MPDKSDRAKAAGCLFSIIMLLLVMPIWFAIMYGVISASNAEQWVWVLFYLYVPIHMVVGFTKVIIEAIFE